jgi:hypothetical protein
MVNAAEGDRFEGGADEMMAKRSHAAAAAIQGAIRAQFQKALNKGLGRARAAPGQMPFDTREQVCFLWRGSALPTPRH